MTRSLYLLRHAKSDWNADYAHDRDRPLNKRGKKAAKRMGKWLTSLGEAPELVLVSPAVRTRETIRLAAKHGEWTAPVQVCDEFYEARPSTILSRVHAVDPAITRVLVCGHEPTMSAIVATLCGGFPPSFPTACCARIDTSQLVWLVPPKTLE